VRAQEEELRRAAGGQAAGEWVEYWDDSAQCYYYFNTRTEEASWTKPGHDYDTDGYDTSGECAYDTNGELRRGGRGTGGGSPYAQHTHTLHKKINTHLNCRNHNPGILSAACRQCYRLRH
jgi:hypothetical protein